MKFIIWVIDQVSGGAGSDEMAAIDAFNESLRDGGQFIMAAGIAAPTEAVVIDNRSGRNQLSEGSLFDSPDFYSGFWIIEATDSAEATTIAKAASAACNRRVELRAFLGQQ